MHSTLETVAEAARATKNLMHANARSQPRDPVFWFSEYRYGYCNFDQRSKLKFQGKSLEYARTNEAHTTYVCVTISVL